jgi:hypothetical protein
VSGNAPKRILRNPPAIHPREPPGTARSAAIFSRASKTSHACTASTLLERQAPRNKKLASCCAETVEEGNSLWKGMEKGERNSWCGAGTAAAEGMDQNTATSPPRFQRSQTFRRHFVSPPATIRVSRPAVYFMMSIAGTVPTCCSRFSNRTKKKISAVS